jgi:Na+/melibiose symporter-like transporter
MRLNYGKTFLIGFGFFGISLIWSVYNVYVPIFLNDRFGLPTAVIGIVMTLDNIAALVIQPVIGVWSDRTRTRLGRRMPYVLAGAPLAALCFVLVPFAQALPLFMAAIMGMLLAMAFFRTPVIALMPDVTPSPLRSQANGVINLMGGLGGLIAFFISGSLYKANPANPFLLGALLLVASSGLLLLFVREPAAVIDEADKHERESAFKDFSALFTSRDRSGLSILSAIFFWFLGYAALEAFFSLYARSHLGIPETESPVQLGLLSVVFVLFAVPAGIIGGRLGRRVTISAGIVIFALMLALVYVLPAPVLAGVLLNIGIGKIYVLSLFLMVCGAGWALININSLPMVVDLSDESKVGTYTGLYYLFSTFAAIIGPIVNGAVIQLLGNNYNVIMLIAPVFLIIALLLISSVRRGEARGVTKTAGVVTAGQ